MHRPNKSTWAPNLEINKKKKSNFSESKASAESDGKENSNVKIRNQMPCKD